MNLTESINIYDLSSNEIHSFQIEIRCANTNENNKTIILTLLGNYIKEIKIYLKKPSKNSEWAF